MWVIHIDPDNAQLRVYHRTGVCRELRDQFIAARDRKPAWLTKSFVWTVRDIEHHNVVSSEILADKCGDEHPRE